MFHADTPAHGRLGGRTDMAKLRDAFRNFANAPKNQYESYTGSYKMRSYKLR